MSLYIAFRLLSGVFTSRRGGRETGVNKHAVMPSGSFRRFLFTRPRHARFAGLSLTSANGPPEYKFVMKVTSADGPPEYKVVMKVQYLRRWHFHQRVVGAPEKCLFSVEVKKQKQKSRFSGSWRRRSNRYFFSGCAWLPVLPLLSYFFRFFNNERKHTIRNFCFF